MSFRMADTGVDSLLGDHTPPIQAIAAALCRLIQETAPEAEERICRGWHAIAGYFGAIFSPETVVKKCFEWGAHHPDTDGVLTGTQKRIRYVEIFDEAEIPKTSIVSLVAAAVQFHLANT